MPLRNFGLSFFRRGARPHAGDSWRPRAAELVTALIVIAVVLVTLWAALARAGEAEDKMLTQRIIAGDWPELANACRLLTLQPQPEWNMPPAAALRSRCLNRAHVYIQL